MGQWIGESEQAGRQAAHIRIGRLIAERKAREAFCNEPVNQEAAERFLEPLKEPMVRVQGDLEASGYRVEDLGYRYNEIASSDQGHYALVHRGRHPEAYGQTWTIYTPSGQQLDILRLFPLVGEATHFSEGYFSLLEGGGRIVKPTDDKDKAIATLQNLIGARIADYFTTRVTRSEG